MGRRNRGAVGATTGLLLLWSIMVASGAMAQVTPAITSSPPLSAQVGNLYAHEFTSNISNPAPTYSVTSGSLPPGLTMSPGGIVAGAPTMAGTFGPTTVCASNGVTTACQTFTIVVNKRGPSIFATPSAGGPLGTPVRDTGSLVFAYTPTGNMTFRLFSDAACTAEVFTSTNVVDVTGVATSSDFIPTVPGTYRWTVSYSGDVNNNPATFGCSETNQVVIGSTSTSTSSTTPTTSTSSTTTSTTSTTSTVPPTSTTSTAPPTSTTSSTSSTTSTSTTSTTTPPTGTTSSSTSSSTSSTSTTATTTPSTTVTTNPGSSTTSSSTPPGSTSTSITPTSTTSPPSTSTTVAPTSTTVAPTSTTAVVPTSTTAVAPTSTTAVVPTSTTAVAPTSTTAVAPTSTTVAVTTSTTVGGPTIQTSAQQVAAGQNLTVSGSRYPPGSTVDADLFSTPVRLGSTTADAGGNVHMVVTVPRDTVPGVHTLRLSVRGGTAFAETTITVLTPLATQINPGTLSRTGAGVAGPARLAVALVVVGFLLVGLSWRERRTPWPRTRRFG